MRRRKVQASLTFPENSGLRRKKVHQKNFSKTTATTTTHHIKLPLKFIDFSLPSPPLYPRPNQKLCLSKKPFTRVKIELEIYILKNNNNFNVFASFPLFR